MSEKEKLLKIIKNYLGTEHNYQTFVSEHNFTKIEKNKLLEASILCNGNNPDLLLMVEAYKVIKNAKTDVQNKELKRNKLTIS